jgi:hypothetical protein
MTSSLCNDVPSLSGNLNTSRGATGEQAPDLNQKGRENAPRQSPLLQGVILIFAFIAAVAFVIALPLLAVFPK